VRSPTTERQAREEEASAWAGAFLQKNTHAFRSDGEAWRHYAINAVSEILKKQDDHELHDFAVAAMLAYKEPGKRQSGRPQRHHRDFVLVILVARLCTEFKLKPTRGPESRKTDRALSACAIAAEATGMEEARVQQIWKERRRIWYHSVTE
jgi:hypothetical protein